MAGSVSDLEQLHRPKWLSCRRFAPKIGKNIFSLYALLLVATAYLAVIACRSIQDYLNTPADNLFYDRLLVLTIFFYRGRWMWAPYAKQSTVAEAVCLLAPGFVMSILAILAFNSRSLSIYSVFIFSLGLVLAWHGKQVWRRALPAFIALMVITYPPYVIYAWLCELARWISYVLAQKIAQLTMAHLIFGDYVISSTEFDFDIIFEPACGGIFFVLSYLSLMILLKINSFDAAVFIKCVITAVAVGVVVNIARIMSILVLVSLGQAEPALHSMHDTIGHVFAAMGVAVLLMLPDNLGIYSKK